MVRPQTPRYLNMSDWASKLSKNPTSVAAKVATGPVPPKSKKQVSNRSIATSASTNDDKRTGETDAYNGAEILHYLHKRFERDMADSRGDSENTVVYRSLESASAWNTFRKRNNDEDGFDLLRELNHSGNVRGA